MTSDAPSSDPLAAASSKAAVLLEALGYIQRFHDKTVVVKVGGSIMDDEAALARLLTDVVFMNYVGMQPVIVHGGGKAINAAMGEAGIEPRFVEGRRYTDDATLGIAEQVLCGQINPFIVHFIRSQGCESMGLTSLGSNVLYAQRVTGDEGQDLGHVGQATNVNRRMLQLLVQADAIPVISTIGIDADTGQKLNVNADTAAGAIAAAMRADKLVVVSDTHGIRRDVDDPATRISSVTAAGIDELIQEGVIAGGMLPKVDACLQALRGGAEKAHIIDGRTPHALLLEIYTADGIGTEITL
ncbi:MAG: acetylglutamate kinase [Planctomycetota bacterium]